MSRARRRGVAAALIGLVAGLALSIGANASPALARQATGPAAPAVAPQGLRVLAIGVLTARATPEAVNAVLPREVPATLRLYLEGYVDDWYVRTDRTGVVFILNVASLEQAHALLDPLPLGQAGLMTFDLIPLAPLQPLGLLLSAPSGTAR